MIDDDDDTSNAESAMADIDFGDAAATPFDIGAMADLEPEPTAESKPDLAIIMDIPVTMQVVLGSAVMPVANLVKLGRGAVVKLDTSIGDPVDLIVNGRIVARGEVVVLENEESRFGITLTEIVSPGARPQRPKSMNA